jgi:toxin secretion/phage lysis holin
MGPNKWRNGQLQDADAAGRDDAWTFFFRFHISYWLSSFPHSVHSITRVVSDDAGGFNPPISRSEIGMVVVSVFRQWELKSVLASVGAMVSVAIGGWDVLSQALVALIALDVIGGLARAFVEKRLNSSVMSRGLVRKSCYFIAIILAVLVDRSVLHDAPAMRTLVISYLCVNEALSVIEHLAAVGVPLPAQLKRALDKVRKELNDDESHPPSQSQS